MTSIASSGGSTPGRPGRTEGTGELFVRDFAAARAGGANVVFREFPPIISLSPAGTFTYTFQVR